jgi:hypothetical protein
MKTKKMLYSTITENIVLYGAEMWEITEVNKKKLQAFQMDFLRRSCGISRLGHVRNDRIKEIMDLDKTGWKRSSWLGMVTYKGCQKRGGQRRFGNGPHMEEGEEDDHEGLVQ